MQRAHLDTLIVIFILLASLATGCAGEIGDATTLGDGPASGPAAGAGPTELTQGQLHLSVTSPSPNSVLHTVVHDVAGRASGVSEVTINGLAVPVIDGHWLTSVALRAGDNLIVAEAGGLGTVEIPVTVDLGPPTVRIKSPVRGSFFDTSDGATVTVEGVVTDETEVATLAVNGQPVEVLASGAFRATVPSTVGINVVEIEAIDSQDNAGTTRVGYMYGSYAPWNELSDDAITASIGPGAFVAVTQAIEGALGRDNIDQLFMANGAVSDQGDFQLEGFDYADIDIDLVPASGFLQARVRIHGLRIDAKATKRVLGIPLTVRGDARSNPAELNCQIHLAPQADGSVGLSVMNAHVEMHSFDLNLDGVLSLLDWAVEGAVRRVAEDTLRDLLNDLVVDQLFDPADLVQTADIMGSELGFNLAVSSVEVTSDGLNLAAGVGVDVEQSALVPVAPGVLKTLGAPPMGNSGDSDVRLSIADDFINRLFWSSWRAGLLNIDLATLVGDDRESLPISLDAGTFSLLAGFGILEHGDSDTPVGIRMRPLLPPVASLNDDDSGRLLRVQMAEMMLDFFLEPESGPAKLWASVSLTLDIAVGFETDGEGKLALDMTIDTQADVAKEPLFDVDDVAFEQLIETIFATLPGLVGDSVNDLVNVGDMDRVQGAVPGVRLAPDVRATADGPAGDFLSLYLGFMVE